MSTPESPLPGKYVCSDDAEARACHLRVVERVLRGKYFPWAGEGYDSHSEVVWWRPPNKKPRRVSVFDKSVGVVCCMGWLARRRAFCNLCEVARPLWYRIIEVWACVLLSQNEKISVRVRTRSFRTNPLSGSFGHACSGHGFQLPIHRSNSGLRLGCNPPPLGGCSLPRSRQLGRDQGQGQMGQHAGLAG